MYLGVSPRGSAFGGSRGAGLCGAQSALPAVGPLHRLPPVRAPPIPDASALRAGGGADSKTILIGTKGIVVPHFGLRPRIRMSINGFTGIIPGASHTAFPPLEFRLPRNEESFVCSGIDNE